MPRRLAVCDEMALPFSVHRMLTLGPGATAHVSATELPLRTTPERGSTVKRGTSLDDDDVITPAHIPQIKKIKRFRLLSTSLSGWG